MMCKMYIFWLDSKQHQPLVDNSGQLTWTFQFKSQEENQQLRDQLKTMDASGSGMSHVEERIIARLEDTISVLAQQVGEFALNNAPTTTADVHAAKMENAPASEQSQ